uniref:RRM domain-containing protein n=1 Tax=Falco tinnunculus TaxID=100819 RepID=A0A8C4TT87_FALTI
GNEYWFDAKEDVTIADSSVAAEEKKKQKGEQDMIDLRGKVTMESGNEYSFIRVGGLCSSVSEGDLRSHFQKYGISDTLISVDSGNCRYINTNFTYTNKAKLAVEEMNQKKIKGKPVSVELVNTSSQTKYSVSQVLTNKLWQEIQPVDNGQRNSQDKTLTSASNSVKAIDTTSASENMLLLPMTSSKVFYSDTGEKFLQKTSAPFSTNAYNDFISPDAVNSSSFTKLLRRLQEIHPEASRAKIVSALLEVRKNNKGILSGLSISSIVERTSCLASSVQR